MNSIKNLDLPSLNQLFLQMSRDFREAIKSGKSPQEVYQLQCQLHFVHQELRTRRFRYQP